MAVQESSSQGSLPVMGALSLQVSSSSGFDALPGEDGQGKLLDGCSRLHPQAAGTPSQPVQPVQGQWLYKPVCEKSQVGSAESCIQRQPHA